MFVTKFVQLPLSNREDEIVVLGIQLHRRIELRLHVCIQFANHSKQQF